MKLNRDMLMVFIWIAQIIAHTGDFLFNDLKMIGVILMVSIVCHLLNK